MNEEYWNISLTELLQEYNIEPTKELISDIIGVGEVEPDYTHVMNRNIINEYEKKYNKLKDQIEREVDLAYRFAAEYGYTITPISDNTISVFTIN